MSMYQNTSPEFQSSTLAYINKLDQRSEAVVAMVEKMPMPTPLRSELMQTWKITRQKLAYFRRELERANGEFRSELEVLHNTLLPEVISYQVRLGAMMIGDTCEDHTYLQQWKRIWNNFS